MVQLFQKFNAIRPLSPGLKAYLMSILVRKEFKKNDKILAEGQTGRYIYFIEKGLVRSVRYKKGKQRTFWLMKEGDFFVSVRSFFSQTPATETIEALEDCILHCISYEQLEKAYEDFPEFDCHGRRILQYYYPLSEERSDMREQSAIDRFEYLMSNQPELVGRVKDKILASYLAMAPQTFSVQKRKFAKRDKKKESKISKKKRGNKKS